MWSNASDGNDGKLAELSQAIESIRLEQARTTASIDSMRELLVALCAHHGVPDSRLSPHQSQPADRKLTQPNPTPPIPPSHQLEPAAVGARLTRIRQGAPGPEQQQPRLSLRAHTLPPHELMALVWGASGAPPAPVPPLPDHEHSLRRSESGVQRSHEIVASFRRLLCSDEASDAGALRSRLASRTMAVIGEGRALIKTVAHADWPVLIGKLAGSSAATPIRTSTSLLPPGGLGMKLYSIVSAHPVGLLFDLDALGLRDGSELGGPVGGTGREPANLAPNCFAWPSGYYAKVEFNLNAAGELLNGRKEALVSLRTLAETNRALAHGASSQSTGHSRPTSPQPSGHPSALPPSSSRPPPVPYNEVYAPIQTEALLSVFARIPTAECVLCAVAVASSFASHASASSGPEHLRELPVLYLPAPDGAPRVLSDETIARAVRAFVELCDGPHSAELRDFGLPICLSPAVIGLLRYREVAVLYGSFGCSVDAARSLVLLVDRDEEAQGSHGGDGGDGSAGARTHAHTPHAPPFALGSHTDEDDAASPGTNHLDSEHVLAIVARSAMRSGNVAALRSVVNVAIERLYDRHARGLDLAGGSLEPAFADASSHGAQQAQPSAQQHQQLQHAATSLAHPSGSAPTSAAGHEPGPLAARARAGVSLNSVGFDEKRLELLVPLGAWLATHALLSGVVSGRLTAVGFTVGDWLRQSPSSVFRVASWMEAGRECRFCGQVHLNHKQITAYLGDRAINNRSVFYEQLFALQGETESPALFFGRLIEMTSKMHQPVFRLELLQFVLGLDCRFGLDALRQALALARECSNMYSAGGAAPIPAVTVVAPT